MFASAIRCRATLADRWHYALMGWLERRREKLKCRDEEAAWGSLDQRFGVQPEDRVAWAQGVKVLPEDPELGEMGTSLLTREQFYFVPAGVGPTLIPNATTFRLDQVVDYETPREPAHAMRVRLRIDPDVWAYLFIHEFPGATGWHYINGRRFWDAFMQGVADAQRARIESGVDEDDEDYIP